MTQEKKLEEAKMLYKDANEAQRYVLELLFPELKESEDKRIRGAIIDHLKDNNLTEWAAWLEKEGEDKLVISDDALREGIAHFGITQYQMNYHSTED